MWLRDLLPSKLPGARILAWQYDSDVTNARHLMRSTLYSNADALINELSDIRQRTKSAKRPIIFLGHSLGGLLIKSALIRSAVDRLEDNSKPGAIRQSTYGIIFLGTPHRGSASDSLGTILRSIAAAYTSQESLLKSIEKESSWLEMQLEQFKSISSKLPTCYCFETRLTRYSRGTSIVRHLIKHVI